MAHDVNDTHLARARRLARAMDSAMAIPGTRIRVGLDPIIGLIPGGGDVASAVLAAYVVLIAVQRGVPRPVVWRMLGNIGVDTLGGSVPLLGDVFDVAYKSNMKNVELLERYVAQPDAVTRRSRWLGILAATAVFLVLLGVAVAVFFGVRLIWRLLTA